MTVGGIAIGSLLRKVGRSILATNVLGLSAQTAYYFFFSLFPLLLFATPLFSLAGDKRTVVDFLMTELGKTVPQDAYRLLLGFVNDVVFAKAAPGIVAVGAVFALWAGSNVFSALTDTLNRACGVNESRAWWKRTLLALAFVIGTSVVVLVAAVVLLDGENVIQFIARVAGLGSTAKDIWTVIEFPIAVGFIGLLTWAIYFVLPDLRLTWREALLGAAIGTTAWVITTLAFRAYVQHFGSYNKTYGTIGAVMVLLIWMYLTMLAILTAGVVAAEVHGERSGHRTPGDRHRAATSDTGPTDKR